jgi:NADH-quinone oxidoreductase subunit M
MIVALSSIGVPGTNGFVGEFLVLLGSFQTQPGYAVIAALSVRHLSAVYLLWAVQRIIFNPLDKPENRPWGTSTGARWPDGAARRSLIIWIGVYPQARAAAHGAAAAGACVRRWRRRRR